MCGYSICNSCQISCINVPVCVKGDLACYNGVRSTSNVLLPTRAFNGLINSNNEFTFTNAAFRVKYRRVSVFPDQPLSLSLSSTSRRPRGPRLPLHPPFGLHSDPYIKQASFSEALDQTHTPKLVRRMAAYRIIKLNESVEVDICVGETRFSIVFPLFWSLQASGPVTG